MMIDRSIAWDRDSLANKLQIEKKCLLEAKAQDFLKLKKRLRNTEMELKKTHVRQRLHHEKRLVPLFSTLPPASNSNSSQQQQQQQQQPYNTHELPAIAYRSQQQPIPAQPIRRRPTGSGVSVSGSGGGQSALPQQSVAAGAEDFGAGDYQFSSSIAGGEQKTPAHAMRATTPGGGGGSGSGGGGGITIPAINVLTAQRSTESKQPLSNTASSGGGGGGGASTFRSPYDSTVSSSKRHTTRGSSGSQTERAVMRKPGAPLVPGSARSKITASALATAGRTGKIKSSRQQQTAAPAFS